VRDEIKEEAAVVVDSQFERMHQCGSVWKSIRDVV
jgi:hypothetical protein